MISKTLCYPCRCASWLYSLLKLRRPSLVVKSTWVVSLRFLIPRPWSNGFRTLSYPIQTIFNLIIWLASGITRVLIQGRFKSCIWCSKAPIVRRNSTNQMIHLSVLMGTYLVWCARYLKGAHALHGRRELQRLRGSNRSHHQGVGSFIYFTVYSWPSM